MKSSKKVSNFKKIHKRAGIYAIVLGVFLIVLFYYQSMDGLITTADHLTGPKRIVSQMESPSEFRNNMLVRYGLAFAFVIMGVLRLRKYK